MKKSCQKNDETYNEYSTWLSAKIITISSSCADYYLNVTTDFLQYGINSG